MDKINSFWDLFYEVSVYGYVWWVDVYVNIGEYVLWYIIEN